MIDEKISAILQSPDDGTPISINLKSEGGIQYEQTESGILILDSSKKRPMDVVYNHPMFQQWDSIVNERIQYYTENKTVAGRLANLSYKSMDRFNNRKDTDFLLDIGCGDGAQIKRLHDKSTYIGIDRNMERLEILKKNYPEATCIYADAAALPFKTGSIPFIYSSNAFEHLWYLKEAVLECYRCTYQTGEAVIIIPTEGGLWNLGRRVFSKPHFQKKHPAIDFELISHIEHNNVAPQVIRILETFFKTKCSYLPFRIPSIYTNALVEIVCTHSTDPKMRFKID